MSQPTPTLNGQIIGQAERSTRALLDRLLEQTGTSFEQWVAINLTAAAGGTFPHDQLIARMSTGLRIAPAGEATIDELTEAGLMEDEGLTPAGRARYDAISTQVAALTARLYAGFPQADLSAAASILLELTSRANTELASAS
jgi:hypothetical protein